MTPGQKTLSADNRQGVVNFSPQLPQNFESGRFSCLQWAQYFGTGFSSLAYLKKFPVNELKIDKSFIIELDKNKNDDVIVRSTIELGHNLGLRIVAEGVENDSIYNSLAELGCDVAQDYYMSRPLDEKAFLEWLKNNYDTAVS